MRACAIGYAVWVVAPFFMVQNIRIHSSKFGLFAQSNGQCINAVGQSILSSLASKRAGRASVGGLVPGVAVGQKAINQVGAAIGGGEHQGGGGHVELIAARSMDARVAPADEQVGDNRS